MRRFAVPLLAAAAVCMPSGALAAEYIFDSSGDNATINLGGDQPGTSSTLYLNLTGISGSTYEFSYTLTNTSNIVLNPGGRVSSFGFSTAPEAVSGTVTGDFTQLNFNPAPGQLGSEVDVCAANSGSCSGSGGATVGDPAQGLLTLTFSGPITGLTLSDFGVRYQSLGLNRDGSGRGFETPVPEPGTWGMMLLGFAGLGLALRHGRKRKSAPLLQVA